MPSPLVAVLYAPAAAFFHELYPALAERFAALRRLQGVSSRA